MNTKKLAIIYDTSGKDDEGMKKIGVNISNEINKTHYFDVSNLSMLSSIKNCREYDLFHFIGGPSYKTILVAFICSLLNRNLKTFLTFTNPFLGKFSMFLISLMKPHLSIVSSNNWLLELNKLNLNVIFFNISGVDTKKFKPIKDNEKIKLRQKLGLPEDITLVLHVGHLKSDRNLKALKQLQKNKDMQVIIIGSTTTKQSNEEISSLIEDGIIVITEYVSDIQEYYQAVDCYVFPTINERAAIQIPLSILEALATNTPVVTTDFGGLKDTFGNFNGSIFYYDNEKNLTNFVREHSMSYKKELKRDLNCLNWNCISEDLIKIYEK